MKAKIGDTCRADELGKAGRGLMYYVACSQCKQPSWRRNSAINSLCPRCATQRQSKLVEQGYEAKRASELGYKISGKDYWLFKDACPDCKTILWRRKEALGKLCTHCVQKSLQRPSTENHPRWVNGRRKRKDGYIEITLAPSDPLFVMAHHKKHIALEHRIVVARSLGRPLKPWEIVHHRNRNRADNQLENLELISAQHVHQSVGIEHQILQRLSQLEAKISDLSIRLSLHEIVTGSSDIGNPELGGSIASECRDFIQDVPSGQRESPSPNES
jgi:uncharacterized Zn finger protein (UPF0148 family)